MTADPSDTIETIQCFDNNTTLGSTDPVCTYSLDNCGDGNTYLITCAEANSCTCRRSNSDGTVNTTEFTLDASCVEFTTEDGNRMGEFVEANCGWNLVIP